MRTFIDNSLDAADMITQRSWRTADAEFPREHVVDNLLCLPSFFQVFEDFIPLLLDLQHLSRAELFVGTYSSNWGRLLHIMREANNKSRETTISVDGKNWEPVRRQLVAEETEDKGYM